MNYSTKNVEKEERGTEKQGQTVEKWAVIGKTFDTPLCKTEKMD